jgi:hypothetical protein
MSDGDARRPQKSKGALRVFTCPSRRTRQRLEFGATSQDDAARKNLRWGLEGKMSHGKTRGIVKVHPDHLRTFLAGPHRAGKRPPAAGKELIAQGFKADHSYDLKDFKGKTIQKLSFMNVYLGASHWAASDMSNIDAALSGAMSDPKLNDVIQQYFGSTHTISTTFIGPRKSDAAVPSTFDRDSVSSTLDALYEAGQLEGLDFSNTVVNLLLPPGAILDTTAAGGVGKIEKGGDADDKDSSLEGLGGYHGSHRTGDGTTVYFAAAVYSQKTAKGTNGIPVWPDSWKNVVATLYHELNEARTDADVERVNATGNDKLLGWYSQKGGEIGDIPISLAGENLHLVFVEEALQNGHTAPIQLMWSNLVGGPGLPF